MTDAFYWCDRAVPFEKGETLAAALRRAGITRFGSGAGAGRHFCGIGSCQNCVVEVAGGHAIETCLTPARPGLRLQPSAAGCAP